MTTQPVIFGSGVDVTGTVAATGNVTAGGILTVTGAITGASLSILGGINQSKIAYATVTIAANSTTASSDLVTGARGSYVFIVEGHSSGMSGAAFIACKSTSTTAIGLVKFVESQGTLGCGLTIAWGDGTNPRLQHEPAHTSDTTDQVYDVMIFSAGT